MYIGNRNHLDAARDALRDQFDAVWMAAETIGPREARAIRCAIALDRPRTQHASGYNWTITAGARSCGSHNRVILA